MAVPESPPRSLTIDRRRHRRIVRDLVVATAAARSGQWWFGALVAGVVVLSVTAELWYAGAALALVLVALQVLAWWFVAVRTARDGLDVGHTITRSYDGDELVLTDVTGQLRLPRGSVLLVRQTGANATVYGRAVSFVLPEEMLDEADIAFLEDRVPSGPALPLAVEVTQEVQDRLLADGTRFQLGTADFLLPYVVCIPMALVGIVTPLWGFLVIGAVLFAISGVPGLVRLRRGRASFRRGLPVGWTLRAALTAEGLSVSWPHATVTLAWDTFDRVTATEHNLVLRHRRQSFGSFAATVLPIDLFGPEEVRQLAAAVPGLR
jgi:hypothetical protein